MIQTVVLKLIKARRIHHVSMIAGMAGSILFNNVATAQTVFLDPGSYPGTPLVINGFDLDGNGWFWWSNHPSCGEFFTTGKVGYKAQPTSEPKRLVTSCSANPGSCTPGRDEAYSYYFGRVGSDVFLYRKSLGTAETDPGILFDANGQNISLDIHESSRLWVNGDYLFYQKKNLHSVLGWQTSLYRVHRDGSTLPEVFAVINGEHFFTEFESFIYISISGQFGIPATGYLFLTEGGRLYVQDKDQQITLSRQNVSDIAILPPSSFVNRSTVYSVENTGGEGNAVGKLYSISPTDGTGTLLTQWNGYHIFEIALANWPDNSPARVFLYSGVPGSFGNYDNFTCYRQETVGNFAKWELFLSVLGGGLKGSREWVYYTHDFKIKGKKSDAPPESIDVEFLGLEITQGVQSLGHDAVLVAGKPTYARAYARLSVNTTPLSSWTTGARLFGTRNGSPLPGSPLLPKTSQQLSTADTLPDQRNLGNGYLFEIPPSWTTPGSTKFELKLNESGHVPETGTVGNNGTTEVNFVHKSNTCLKFRPLKTIVSPYYADSPGSGLPEILQRCKSMLPISDFDVRFDNSLRHKPVFFVEIEWVICFPFICPVPIIKVRSEPFNVHDGNDNDRDWAIFWLGVDRLLESSPCDDYHLVGTVHPDITNFNGIGGRGDLNLTDLWDEFPDVAIPNSDWASVLVVNMRTDTAQGALTPGGSDVDVPFNTFYGGRTLAHELGHNYGRKHINQGNGGCGGSTPDGPYDFPPFNTCTFGASSASSSSGAVAGFDVIGERPVRNDLGIFGDLMSYSDARWTSVWTWNIVANHLPQASKAPLAATQVEEDTSWIVVKGYYDTVSGEAFLMPSEILPNGILPDDSIRKALEAEAEMPDGTPIEICQLDTDGTFIRRHKAVPFAMPQEGDAPREQLWFLQVIRCEPDMASIILCDKGEMVACLPRSPNPPHVTVNNPVYDATNSFLHLSWNASDPDGSPLLFSVFYSANNGATWQVLDSNLNTTELSVSTRFLPGGNQARIRVIACDGMDTSISESDPFVCPISPPDLRINNLPEGIRIPYGQSVTPLIFAYDDEDGLRDPAWNLNGPTHLTGNGDTPTLSHLSPGTYSFIATAKDSDGMVSEEQRGFQVLPVEVTDSAPPVLDGYCADTTYDTATKITVDTDNGDVTVNVVHSGNRLYIGVCNIPYAPLTGDASVGIVVDTDGNSNPGEGPGFGERGFFINDDGLPWQATGDGTELVKETEPPLGFLTAVQRGASSWSAEFSIDDTLLNGWDHAARLFVRINHTGNTNWPETSTIKEPTTWAAAWFGTLPTQTNQIPVAAVRDKFLVIASQVSTIFLNGHASEDPDGDELTYNWTQISGPPITLTNSDSAQASFMPPSVSDITTMVFQLVVNDSSLASAPVQTTVTLLPDPNLFTEPGTSGSKLMITDASYDQDTSFLDLLFAGQPGQTYHIQSSTNGFTWSTNSIGRATADAAGLFDYSKSIESSENMLLFRAMEQP